MSCKMGIIRGTFLLVGLEEQDGRVPADRPELATSPYLPQRRALTSVPAHHGPTGIIDTWGFC